MRALKLSIFLGVLIAVAAPAAFAALPSTTKYELNSFGFGSGGTSNSTTTKYGLEGITGEVSGQPASGSKYGVSSGFVQTQQANVPEVTISNPNNYYDKLRFVIDAQNNPSDALYALQVCVGASFTPISCTNNGGTVMYVEGDDTLGATLTNTGPNPGYELYSFWNTSHSDGTYGTIIGLSASTTYYIRAKATQGKYTESAYGPSTSASTVGQQLSLCVYSSPTCSTTTSEAFGALLPGTVANSPSNIGVDFATNADSGGSVYIYSANGGLKSTSANYTITSATANLASASEGFGARVVSAGSPLSAVSPYAGSGNNVGILSTNVNTILTSTTPIVSSANTIQLQALASGTTPAATDYSETLTIIAAAAF